MNLNVDILVDHLAENLSIKQHGHSSKKLRLFRPLLYDGQATFQTNHLYVTSWDCLPNEPVLEKGTVIIVVGTNIPQAYYTDSCALLVIDPTKNLQAIFNRIQKIFDTYDDWDDQLQRITMERGTLASLLDTSRSIFHHPLFILDKNLELTAHSLSDEPTFDLNKELTFTLEDSFIKSSVIQATHKKKALCSYIQPEYEVMYIHLFKKEKLIGSMYMKTDFIRPFQSRDQALFLHLKTYVDFLLNQYHQILSVDNNILKNIFTKLLNGEILNDTKLLNEIKLNHQQQDAYICIKFKLENGSKIIPAKVICDQIENIIPNTVAMVYQNVIVAFMNTSLPDNLYNSEGSIFINFLQAMGYKAGLSKEFTDIFQAKYHFIEACAAIDIGHPLHPDLEVYYFKDYMNEYILSRITSEIPTEIICEKGLLRLLDYDKVHKTTYYNELRTYLNFNMNAVQAAKNLYMHRNTLLIHLEHIIKLAEINLDDPEERMYIQLSYKLLEREGIR